MVSSEFRGADSHAAAVPAFRWFPVSSVVLTHMLLLRLPSDGFQ
jgi:hypothetical protein